MNLYEIINLYYEANSYAWQVHVVKSKQVCLYAILYVHVMLMVKYTSEVNIAVVFNFIDMFY